MLIDWRCGLCGLVRLMTTRLHHLHHNDVDHDHSWRPNSRAEFDNMALIPGRFFRYSAACLAFVWPIYLCTESRRMGFTGNHFNPWSPMFEPKERAGIIASVACVAAVVGVLCYLTAVHGAMLVAQAYVVPYFVFVIWIDTVTYLQHMDEKCLYFRGKSWSFVSGAMSTYDRTYRHLIDPLNLGYGRVLDDLHHNISDAHVVHHLFAWSIPHYNLSAATEAIKPVVGEHYRFDPTPVPVAVARSMRRCCFVEDGVECQKPKPWEAAKVFFEVPIQLRWLLGMETKTLGEELAGRKKAS